MKIVQYILLSGFFCTLSISAEVYKCEISGKVQYTDTPCGGSSLQRIPDIKYISFKYGGSACPNSEIWISAIDKLANRELNPLKEIDSRCKYLRENSVVLGIYQSLKHRDSEFIQVQTSSGDKYWLERGGVYPIVSESDYRPNRWDTGLKDIK